MSSFLAQHSHPLAREVCARKLEKRLALGAQHNTYARRPADAREIDLVRCAVARGSVGIFGKFKFVSKSRLNHV